MSSAPKMTPKQATIAEEVGYFVDVSAEDKWLRRKTDWLGPEPATECEMELWKALEGAK